MSKVQVLVATMNQKDFSLIEKQNIRCDVVYANQADYECEKTINTPYGTAKMISTKTRGVGINRNIALENATGEILLFSDDDVIYCDDMPEQVEKAFLKFPQADVIMFGIALTKNGEIIRRKSTQTGKVLFWKSLKYGMVQIAIRNESIKKKNIKLSDKFGGGCIYCHGEDADFIMSCYKKGLKVYEYAYELGTTATDTSTWFTGFGEKYFYDTGALAKSSFGIVAIPFIVRACIRTQGENNMSFFNKLKYMLAGYKNYDRLLTYDEWKKEQEK